VTVPVVRKVFTSLLYRGCKTAALSTTDSSNSAGVAHDDWHKHLQPKASQETLHPPHLHPTMWPSSQTSKAAYPPQNTSGEVEVTATSRGAAETVSCEAAAATSREAAEAAEDLDGAALAHGSQRCIGSSVEDAGADGRGIGDGSC
jgi:hypothetical protein